MGALGQERDGLSQCTNAVQSHELKGKNLDSSSAGPTLQARVKL